MSLQIWLPLTKDLRQQGLSNVTVVNNGATFNSAGKLGGCYYFNRSTPNYLKITNPLTTTTNGVSMAFWVKLPSNGSVNDQLVHIGNGSGWNNNRFTCFVRGGNSTLIFACGDGTNSTQYSCTSSALTLNQWTHVVCLYENNKMKIYLNGVLDKEYSTTIVPSFTNVAYIGVGAGPNVTEPATAYLNDIRVYDHALSQMEVKELAKGLVLHYPLNRQGWGQENLLKYTKVNATNQNLLKTVTSSWDKLTLTTKDGYDCYLYPADQSSTWFASGQWYTNMKANTTYTYTAWIYFTATANFTFTSLGHFQVYNSASTASDKAHEDVVSARIYQPSTIPANKWTKVRITFTTNDLANSYFVIYPRYSIAANTGDLYFRDCKLEESAVPTPWCPHSVDNEYIIMGLNSTTEYDCSGFGNNSTRVGTFNWTSDTPKYSVSTIFPTSGNNYINIGTQLYNMRDEMTVSIWVKPNDWTSTSKGVPFSSVEGGGFGWQASSANYVFYCGSGTSSNTYLSSTVAVSGLSAGWHMLSATYNGLVLKIYIDGELKNTVTKYTTKTPIYYNINSGMFVSGESGGSLTAPNGSIFRGSLSDLRIYAVALSDTDIKSLYNNCAYIDSSGNVYGAVHEEV